MKSPKFFNRRCTYRSSCSDRLRKHTHSPALTDHRAPRVAASISNHESSIIQSPFIRATRMLDDFMRMESKNLGLCRPTPVTGVCYVSILCVTCTNVSGSADVTAVYTHTHIHTYTHIHDTHKRTHTHIRTQTHTYIYTYTSTPRTRARDELQVIC